MKDIKIYDDFLNRVSVDSTFGKNCVNIYYGKGETCKFIQTGVFCVFWKLAKKSLKLS